MGCFCNSVVAEVRRLEAVESERRKANFLGSMSHEMRSPLHGLLAGIELLRNTKCSPFQHELLETSFTCGRTLLHTIDHALDFAGISGPRFSDSSGFRARGSVDVEQATYEGSSTISRRMLDKTLPVVDLARLCEEVVDGIFLDTAYGRTTSSNRNSLESVELDASDRGCSGGDVSIIVDTKSRNWMFQIKTG